MKTAKLEAAISAYFGRRLPKEAARTLEEFLLEVQRGNERVRLVGDASPELVLVRHLADALPLAGALASGARLLDVGSGGGFPGLVVAIVRPDVQVLLLEKARQKTAVLARMASRLAPQNSRVVVGRFPQAHWNAATDLVSRATFPPEEWVRLATDTPGAARRIWLLLTARQAEGPEWRRLAEARGWQVARERGYELDEGRRRVLVCLETRGRDEEA